MTHNSGKHNSEENNALTQNVVYKLYHAINVRCALCERRGGLLSPLHEFLIDSADDNSSDKCIAKVDLIKLAYYVPRIIIMFA